MKNKITWRNLLGKFISKSIISTSYILITVILLRERVYHIALLLLTRIKTFSNQHCSYKNKENHEKNKKYRHYNSSSY